MSNLKTRRKPVLQKVDQRQAPNYGIDIEDEVEDMNLDNLFDEDAVPPQEEKQ